MQGGQRQTIVYDGRRPLRAGWYDLILHVAGEEAMSEPVLAATEAGGETDRIEFALAPAETGTTVFLLRFEQRLTRLVIFGEDGSAGRDVAVTARLARVSRIELVRRALVEAPADFSRAVYWRMRGKKLRAGNLVRRIFAPPPGIDYRGWLAVRDAEWSGEIADFEVAAYTIPAERLVIVLMLAGREPPSEATLASIRRDSGGFALRLIVVPGPADRTTDDDENPAAATRAEQLNAALGLAGVDWLIILANGDLLTRGALARLLTTMRENPEAAVITGDFDLVDGEGRRRSPRFTPRWNEPLALGSDDRALVVVRRSSAQAVGGFNALAPGLDVEDLLLRLGRALDRRAIVRIPRVLHHRPMPAAPDSPARRTARMQLASRHLAQHGDIAAVSFDRAGHMRFVRELPQPFPRVSVIVPTRDRLDLLRPCIESLRQRTDYPDLEILIADNGSRNRSTLGFFNSLKGDARIRVLSIAGPFNFADINNRAVEAATGSILAFVNNDVEVIEPGWLRQMAALAARPHIGAVGAKLLYPSGSVQHAGIVIGIKGIAGHMHRFFPADHRGYMHRLQREQYVSAVTAACLVVERRKFAEVGGFDAMTFAVALNDADLCLEFQARGWNNCYCPEAVLWHRESASRARDVSRHRSSAFLREVAAFRNKWPDIISDDPFYNPNLTRTEEDFSLL
ncbi:MAG: glycosyltransferase family 2 protein [Hyphomicrobium sp.]